MRLVVCVALMVMLAGKAEGQRNTLRTGEGWEAFPWVNYEGGDGTMPKKKYGVLVLTDSTIAFHDCRTPDCTEKKDKLLWKLPAHLSVDLRKVTDVSSSTQFRGTSATNKILFGSFAGDESAEYFAFSYDSEKTAEAPVFKTVKTQAAALEAKVRFRLKKLGVALAAPDR